MTTLNEQQKTYYIANTITTGAFIITGSSVYKYFNSAQIARNTITEVITEYSTKDMIPTIFVSMEGDVCFTPNNFIPNNIQTAQIISTEVAKLAHSIKTGAEAYGSLSAFVGLVIAFDLPSILMDIDLSDQHFCELAGISDWCPV